MQLCVQIVVHFVLIFVQGKNIATNITMEEVDSIILQFLRRLNININDDLKNICDLPVDVIIASVSRCVSTINPSIKVPTELPTGVSQKIEVAGQIASICKDLGYKNDVGYQTFLYYNETDLRQVFMFLIEKLPSEEKQTMVNVRPVNKKNNLMQEISIKIDKELNSIWIPPCCNNKDQMGIGDFVWKKEQPAQNSEINDNFLVEKLIKANKIMQSTMISSPAEEYNHLPDEKKPEQDNVGKSLKELKEMAFILRQKLDTLESERNVMDVEFSQILKLYEKSEADLKNVQNILRDVGIDKIDQDDSIDAIVEKIKKNINNLHMKSEKLTSLNLNLKVEIDKIHNNITTESERSRCKKILMSLKETARTMKEQYEKKEELINQMKIRYDKLKGGNKRHIYTKRILEIIGNVDKQNMEITKILEDTRKIQKEINILEGQLNRCFSIADETLFKDAKKDDQAKKAYKLLALLHSECNTIVSLVNETGNLSREIVDLEDNIKTEKSKRTEDVLKKVQMDLTKLQNETA